MPKFLKLLIATIALFAIVNTGYFWYGLTGFWLLPITLLLVVTYVILLISFFIQVVYLIRENLKNRYRLLVIGIMAILLGAIFIWPGGIINFYKLEREEDKVTAFQEGTANCTVTLHLKSDDRFILRSVCFGVDDLRGRYTYKNDTLKLDYSTVAMPHSKFQYGVLQTDGKTIYFYRSMKDSLPYPMRIIKGRLK